MNRKSDPPPNAWWREFDKALHHGLTQKGWSALRSEEYAKEQAERLHPNGNETATRLTATTAGRTKDLAKVRRAAHKATLASEQRDEAIRAAHAAGAPIRAIAAEAGISFQRVHQILHRK